MLKIEDGQAHIVHTSLDNMCSSVGHSTGLISPGKCCGHREFTVSGMLVEECGGHGTREQYIEVTILGSKTNEGMILGSNTLETACTSLAAVWKRSGR